MCTESGIISRKNNPSGLLVKPWGIILYIALPVSSLCYTLLFFLNILVSRVGTPGISRINAAPYRAEAGLRR